jgi:hypothetical protein
MFVSKFLAALLGNYPDCAKLAQTCYNRITLICTADSSTLKMMAAVSSETSVNIYLIAWRHIQEILQSSILHREDVWRLP